MYLQEIKNHLKDNKGMTDIGRMIIIAITFVAGAILIYAVVEIMNTMYPAGTKGKISDILD